MNQGEGVMVSLKISASALNSRSPIGKISLGPPNYMKVIVGKGGHAPPPFSKISPLSRSPRCPHLSWIYWENRSTE